MKPLKTTKTPEQVEFTDLVEGLKKFGYNQKQVAKVCRYSDGMVSMIISGLRPPGGAELELLRREHARLTDPNYQDEVSKERKDELCEQINYLKEHAPAAYKAAKLSVDALHKVAVAGEPTRKPGGQTEEHMKEVIDETRRAIRKDEGMNRQKGESVPPKPK